MGYISYFDLLGTRGFCEDPEIYYNNITIFYKSIQQLSHFLKNNGRVGVFSDCAYAESNDLEYLLDFLVELRDRLSAHGLFFNAIVKSGELGIENILSTNSPEIFGVVFKNSSIADLYISQVKFKGIGILLDNSIINDVKKTSYNIINSIYISKKFENETEKFIPIPYMDIAFSKPRYGAKSIINTLDIFYHTFYSAYAKSPRYASYYLSALVNLLRSYCEEFNWNMTSHEFSNVPIVFKTITNIFSQYYDDLSKIPGIEYLSLVMLDVIYNSNQLKEIEKKDITKKFVDMNCIKNKFIHALDEIPDGIFTNNNKNVFVKFCQQNLSINFVDGILT